MKGLWDGRIITIVEPLVTHGIHLTDYMSPQGALDGRRKYGRIGLGQPYPIFLVFPPFSSLPLIQTLKPIQA